MPTNTSYLLDGNFYNNCQNYRVLIGSQLLSIRVHTIKMMSDETRALSQRKIKLIPLVNFPWYCKKQINGSFLWSVLL